MECYVGLDVSLKETSIRVVDGDGEIVCEGTVLSEPEAIAEFVKTRAAGAKRIGKGGGNVFSRRVEELIADQSLLQEAVRPLLAVRESVRREIADLHRKLLALAREDKDSRLSMTVPGIGPITALAFHSVIDAPARFRRSRSVGAYIGLTPRRHASGEIDWSGRISKCGDRMLRTYLFEAAGVLLTRVPQWCKLKARGHRPWKRIGFKKAKVAVARKLVVVLHRMWRDETDFIWSSKEATA